LTLTPARSSNACRWGACSCQCRTPVSQSSPVRLPCHPPGAVHCERPRFPALTDSLDAGFQFRTLALTHLVPGNIYPFISFTRFPAQAGNLFLLYNRYKSTNRMADLTGCGGRVLPCGALNRASIFSASEHCQRPARRYRLLVESRMEKNLFGRQLSGGLLQVRSHVFTG